jgi:inosine/xanthosine triphosphate pyrophosphatase family protein
MKLFFVSNNKKKQKRISTATHHNRNSVSLEDWLLVEEILETVDTIEGNSFKGKLCNRKVWLRRLFCG